MRLGAPLATAGPAGIQIILSVPCSTETNNYLVSQVYIYEPLDINLSMAHSAIFCKTLQFGV